MSVEITDADVQDDVGAALEEFVALRSILPPGFPHHARFGITRERMQAYSDDRQQRFWHLLNIPLALHAYRNSENEKVRKLMGSLLRTLNDFVVRLGSLPGARSLLAPLWEDAWTATPQLWSIASCAYVALCYHNSAIEVVGFEHKIGNSTRDADITVRLGGRITHVEVEAHHRADFGDKTDREVMEELERRADVKAGAKFGALPSDEVGVIAVVCVVQHEDVHRPFELGRVLPLGGRNSIGWMPLRLVGVAHPDGLRFAILPL